ncbi:MAG: alanine dehydrogenase, partial [Candidatus Omnitrophica bacterium]|nr:alanine dehydrogenase [Candidatus Omnitrophota bacterium]
MLTVGIPKEIKPYEKRVGLIPVHVRQLCRHGAKVIVEKDAGLASGFSDREYQDFGAQIVSEHADVFQEADFIQKVKEPQPGEFPYLRSGQILFCFLHLASPAHCQLIRVLMDSRILAIGYETVTIDNAVPILRPMSEIAGGLAAAYAAYFRTLRLGSGPKIYYPFSFQEDLEKIASHYPVWPPEYRHGSVIVFGGGSSGEKVAEFVLGMHGEVVLVEKNLARCQ